MDGRVSRTNNRKTTKWGLKGTPANGSRASAPPGPGRCWCSVCPPAWVCLQSPSSGCACNSPEGKGTERCQVWTAAALCCTGARVQWVWVPCSSPGQSVPMRCQCAWLQDRPLRIHSCTTSQNQHKPGVMDFAVDCQVGLQHLQPVSRRYDAHRYPQTGRRLWKEGRVRWFPSF